MYHIPLDLQCIYGCNDEGENRDKEQSKDCLRYLVKARSLQIEYATRVLHESLLVPILMYGNETKIWKEKERSRIRAVQRDNKRDLLGIRRMDKVQNTQIRQLYKAMKGVDEKIDEGVFRWFGHVEECAGSCSMGR